MTPFAIASARDRCQTHHTSDFRARIRWYYPYRVHGGHHRSAQGPVTGNGANQDPS